MVGVGKGAENGILIRDAKSLENAGKISVVAFDKTGTLTEGKPEVEEIIWEKDCGFHSDIIALLSVASASEHPLAKAIANHFLQNEYKIKEIKNFKNYAGLGITAQTSDILIGIGSIQFLENLGMMQSSFLKNESDRLLKQGCTVVYAGSENKVIVVIGLTDKLKINAQQTVSLLKEIGIKTILLTGDNEQTARIVSEKTGINNFAAALLPSQKAEYLKNIRGSGEIIAMVGDGINDAQALTEANVSMAMGKGSDIAIDVADITLVTSDPIKVTQAIRLSKFTIRAVKQNLFWAFVYNVVGIPVAAGILFPFFGYLLNPMIAGAAMALSSVSVVMNSLRLRYVKF